MRWFRNIIVPIVDIIVKRRNCFRKLLNIKFVTQVEVVMGLEEEFGISVEEENAQSIQTVQDAADMIEGLLEKKHAA